MLCWVGLFVRERMESEWEQGEGMKRNCEFRSETHELNMQEKHSYHRKDGSRAWNEQRHCQRKDEAHPSRTSSTHKATTPLFLHTHTYFLRENNTLPFSLHHILFISIHNCRHVWMDGYNFQRRCAGRVNSPALAAWPQW